MVSAFFNLVQRGFWFTLFHSCHCTSPCHTHTTFSSKKNMLVVVQVDSDWAKGLERKSTSGGMMMINGTVGKHWSRIQATRALTTAEAEYYVVVTGTTEALGSARSR